MLTKLVWALFAVLTFHTCSSYSGHVGHLDNVSHLNRVLVTGEHTFICHVIQLLWVRSLRFMWGLATYEVRLGLMQTLLKFATQFNFWIQFCESLRGQDNKINHPPPPSLSPLPKKKKHFDNTFILNCSEFYCNLLFYFDL